ncbi:MAG: tyrosine-type recombinase/integrase [Akkermansiaceae bacterium]|nr:tyrosine-type recombinase/integrase [Akkermansiaceae bacterium]
MIQNIPHHELVGKLAVSPMDIMRLFVEFAEEAAVTQSDKAEIISAFRRIIRTGVSSVAESERSVPFETAVRESLQVRQIRRPSTIADLRSYTNRMLEFAEYNQVSLRSMTSEQCMTMLRCLFGHSPHVFRKAKAVLHSVFAYGQRRGWCHFNPVKAIECPPVYEERIIPLTGSQIRALMRACRHKDLCSMLPAMQLLLWCGVRPGEVRRLRWRDIDRREKVVYIEGRVSKTGGPRAVPLRGAARELLHNTRPGDELIAPRNWNRLWRKLRKRAGLHNWQRDVLRHTFASYHLKCFHNLPQLQEEMGHRDCNLLRTRYLNVRHVSSATARRFFA